MSNTYKAILRGNHLEWSGDTPTSLLENQTVMVYVTILDDATISQGQRMAAALEQLALQRASMNPDDPAAWERNIRQDRILPDRESDVSRQ